MNVIFNLDPKDKKELAECVCVCVCVCEELVWKHEMRRVFCGEEKVCVEVKWETERQLRGTNHIQECFGSRINTI